MHSAASIESIDYTVLAQACAEEPPPKSQPRVRLGVDVRRAQLLELGRELFRTRAYEDLSIGEIARAAGISKGLLYHYFPGKRAFYVESLRQAAAELVCTAMPPRELAPLERLRAGLDVYLDYVARHKTVFSSLIWRGVIRDAEVSRIVEATKLEFFDRLLGEIVATPPGRNVLRGWLGFVEATVLDWIDTPDVTQRELSDLFVAVFQQVVGPAAERSRRTGALDIPA